MRECILPNIDGGKDVYPCYTPQEFDYTRLRSLAIKTANKNRGTQYLTNICTFDIETTTLSEEKLAYMYIWQSCIDGYCIYGRTWREYLYYLGELYKHLRLSQDRLLTIYVHNLGFEFMHVKDFMALDYGNPKIFAAQRRKPIRVNYDGFEYRCSWKLSNMSLEKFVKNEKGVRHLKQSGDLDYRIIRTPETTLLDREFAYCIGDVVSLYEAIRHRLMNENDNLETVPMTSTSYVRRDCRKAANAQKGYREMFTRNRMTEPVYNLLKDASRGGDTHANRNLSGRILMDVDSYDVQSSYPYVMVCKKFPMTAFVPYGTVESRAEFESLLETHACLFRLTVTGMSIRDGYGMPYIPDAKCIKLINPVLDNGRVLSADGAQIVITDIDYRIIKEQYKMDEDGEYITDLHIADYGYLPESLVRVIMQYFGTKTQLKSQKEENKIAKIEDTDTNYYYDRSKNRLNGIFGMCFTDPVHDIIEMLENGTWKEYRPDDIEAALKKYNTSRNSFLVYAWGIWTTAHARSHLARLRRAAGEERVAYQDTDSAKGNGFNLEEIERQNDMIKMECEERGAYYDCKGKRYYLGIYERDEGTPYQQFKTLGAKKYCYEDVDGKLHLTVSGVQKEEGAQELGSIENFYIGFIFKKAGGLELVYNNSSIHKIVVDGCEIETASNIAMLDSTYMLGATPDYLDLIGYDPIDIINFKQRQERHRKGEKL